MRFHSRVDDRLRYWRFTNDSDMQHVRALPKSETEDHVSNGEFDGREGWLVGTCWSLFGARRIDGANMANTLVPGVREAAM